MRIVIKNADFSSVSIGKVIKDLSFSFDSADGVAAINAFFPNYNSGTPTNTTYYTGASGSTVTEAGTTNARLVTDFIEVEPGMIINAVSFDRGSASEPSLIAFNASKEIISSACGYVELIGSYKLVNFVIPDNVKYIKLQMVTTSGAMSNLSNGNTKVSASMPTT